MVAWQGVPPRRNTQRWVERASDQKESCVSSFAQVCTPFRYAPLALCLAAVTLCPVWGTAFHLSHENRQTAGVFSPLVAGERRTEETVVQARGRAAARLVG